VWYAERPRGRHASHGRHAARCPALHSPRRTAAPGPGECPAAAGTPRRGSPAGRPETRRAAGQGPAVLGLAQAARVDGQSAPWRLPRLALLAEVTVVDGVA